MKLGKGEIISILIMILLPVSALGLLYYSLETYTRTVHNDSGFLVGAHAIGCMVVTVVLWLKMRKKGKKFTVIAAISLALLSFVLIVAEKIPFCVQCDQVTKEELGFLTYWIPPMDA